VREATLAFLACHLTADAAATSRPAPGPATLRRRRSGLILLASGSSRTWSGITGGASAIVFNALFSLGWPSLAGGLTLLDGLYCGRG
jgi:hypothetical protein